MVDKIASHLQQAKAYARALFVYYTSAFNKMQIHLILERLLVLVLGVIIHWIKNVLIDRPQQVCIRGLNQIRGVNVNALMHAINLKSLNAL